MRCNDSMRLRAFLLASMSLFFASSLAFADDQATRLAFGEAPPKNITFTDIHFLPRQLSEFGQRKAYVIVFTTLECPVVRRSLPKLRELEREYRDRGVQFVAINVGAQDMLIDVASQALAADLPFPVGKDYDGRFARALGATRTPEVVLLDQEFKLRYRGRIDAEVRLGGVSPRKARADLKEALDDVLAGQAVRVPETPVDGCLIEYDSLDDLPARVPQRVTFAEHVAPLLAKHCQECHRDGAIAPFSLVGYEDAKAHAETIAEVVREGRMPPSFAGRQHVDIVNRRELTAEERALIIAWARQGAEGGDLDALPPPPEFSDQQWKIGEPDLVLEMGSEMEVPAEGYIPYRYAVLPHVFWKDTWVQKIEIKPGNRDVLHHCNAIYVSLTKPNDYRNFITGYVPGGDPMVLTDGVAYLIPAGSMIVLQLHYITTGEPARDRTSIGFVFAKETVQKQLRHYQGSVHRFEIPPLAPHFPLTATRTLREDATGVGMFAHMHLRGKDMTYKVIYPDGREEVLLTIPNYDFNWQLSYRWAHGAKRFPKGTKIEVTAHFDNSEFNPFNPAPEKAVREGEQTFDEMMYGFFFYTHDNESLNLQIDPNTGHVLKEKAADRERRRTARTQPVNEER